MPLITFLQQVQNCPAPKWKARLKTATQEEILTQATQEDLAQLEGFQKEAFGTLGIPIGHKEEALLWPCSLCSISFFCKQSMRMHHATTHRLFAHQSHLRNRITL